MTIPLEPICSSLSAPLRIIARVLQRKVGGGVREAKGAQFTFEATAAAAAAAAAAASRSFKGGKKHF